MEGTTPSLEELALQALQLSPAEKLQLIERLVFRLRYDIGSMEPRPGPRRSLYGALAHLGPAPSAEEIDEARREEWANFPREDIGK